jgi:hypothetical protein
LAGVDVWMGADGLSSSEDDSEDGFTADGLVTEGFSVSLSPTEAEPGPSVSTTEAAPALAFSC